LFTEPSKVKIINEYIIYKNSDPIKYNELVTKLQLPSQEISTPLQSSSINKSGDLVCFSNTHPEVILKDSYHRIFYRGNPRFRNPFTQCFFMFILPGYLFSAPLNCVYLKVFCRLLKQILNEEKYYMELASVGFNLSPHFIHGSTIEIQFGGFSDRIAEVVKYVGGVIYTFEPSEENYNLFLLEVENDEKNTQNSAPYQYSLELSRYFRLSNYSLSHEYLATFKNASFEDFKYFLKKLWDVYFVECAILGNLSEDDAILISNNILPASFSSLSTSSSSLTSEIPIIKKTDYFVPRLIKFPSPSELSKSYFAMFVIVIFIFYFLIFSSYFSFIFF
jgi:secreted Zn-dependent insulinase-like peptidase